MISQQPTASLGTYRNRRVPALRRWREEPAPPVATEGLDAQRLLAIFRRRASLFTAIAILIFALFAITTLLAKRTYTAQAEIVVDARREQIVDAAPVVQDLSRSTNEANIVDTQVQLLRSRQLAERVAQQLQLARDPEFNAALQEPTGLAAIRQAVVGESFSPPDAEELNSRATRQAVADALLSRLSIRRNGLTYVIGVAFTSEEPAKAARIADAFAETFLAMQLEAKAEATRRVNEWLGERVENLRLQVQQSEGEVQRYRIANNLISATGTPLTEQEISNYSQQAATARALLAEDQARLNTARAQLARGSSGEDVGEALGSKVIETLRAQRAEVSARLAGYQGRYGARHPELIKAQQELADIDGQIRAEVKRIISNLEARSQVSRQRMGSIQGTLNSAQGTLAANNVASVRLNELERNAQAVKAVYESFLNRYKETSAMIGMAQPDARLVSSAKVPTEPSSPNVTLDLTLGSLVAVMGGLAAVCAAELLTSVLGTGEEVEHRTGAAYLGSVPLLDASWRRYGSPLGYLVSRPLSAFAESLKGLRTSLLQAGPGGAGRVIVVTSALPGEGKTVTSVCLAGSLALHGHRTVLVDCDARNPSLTRQLNSARVGLLEVLQGSSTLEEALVRDEQTGAYFLPLMRGSEDPGDLFGSEAMRDLLERLRREYDTVILDTPPVLGVADTRELAPFANVVLVLAQWRKTPRKAVQTALKMLESTGAYVAGVALTQVDMKQQARTGYGDPGYYYKKYKAYYIE
jgi:polysaccharide biosynthesis transport protein